MGELEEWSARHQVLKATLPHRVVSSCSSFKTNQKFQAAAAQCAAGSAGAAGAAGAAGSAVTDDEMRQAVYEMSNYEVQKLVTVAANARGLIAQDLLDASRQNIVFQLRQGEFAREELIRRAQFANSEDDEEDG